MSPQANPSHLPKLCITKEIWYPAGSDASSKTPSTANTRDHSPGSKTLPNRKHKSRFFSPPHVDTSSKEPLTNPLPSNPPATPPPTPESPSFSPTRCSPILPSPSTLLPLPFFPSPPPPLPLSPIAPPSPYYHRHQRKPQGEDDDNNNNKDEAYEKFGSAALLQEHDDNIPYHYLEDNKDKTSFWPDIALYYHHLQDNDNVTCLQERNATLPYFGSGHGPNGRDINTQAVKTFFEEQCDRRRRVK